MRRRLRWPYRKIICPACFEKYHRLHIKIEGISESETSGVLDYLSEPYRRGVVRSCQKCMEKFPEYWEMADVRIIGLVGLRGSGKSSFNAAILRELTHPKSQHMLTDLGWHCEFIDHRGSGDLRYRLYDRPFWEDLTQLTATVPVANDPPFIVKLAPGKGRRKVYLVLFDAAGESMDNPTHLNYISHASGLIFLLDPEQLLEPLWRVGMRILLKE